MRQASSILRVLLLCILLVDGRLSRAQSSLGPRLGKYAKDGRVIPIQGSNLALATLGTFIFQAWLVRL